MSNYRVNISLFHECLNAIIYCYLFSKMYVLTSDNTFILLQPIDSKREEFRKYLERAGVMDALTKVLVSLYEEAEKPDDALEYPFRG
jgi:hypothetical protein